MSKQTYTTIVICRECGGTGKLINEEFRGHSERFVGVSITCTTCGGSGRMRKVKTVEFLKMEG